MLKLRYGHWISVDNRGVLVATSYDPEFEVGPISMADHGSVQVIIKSHFDRRLTTISKLAATIQQMEAKGDVIREVFVADVVEFELVKHNDVEEFYRQFATDEEFFSRFGRKK